MTKTETTRTIRQTRKLGTVEFEPVLFLIDEE